MKIPGITQAHERCAMKTKEERNDHPPIQIFFEKKVLTRQYSRMAGWISMNFGILIPNRLKVLILE